MGSKLSFNNLSKDKRKNKESTINERLATEQPKTILDASFSYDTAPLIFSDKTNTNGTVSHDSDRRAKDIQIDGSDGSEVIRQSRKYLQYVPGHQISIATGFKPPVEEDGLLFRIGLFDDNNGTFWEQDGSTYSVVRRTSVSGTTKDNKVQLGENGGFNLDPLDGGRDSRFNFDPQKFTMLRCDTLHYGGAGLRWGLQLGDEVLWFHMFEGSGNLDEPLYGNANLPLRIQIKAKSSLSESKNIILSGASAKALGRNFSRVFPFSADTGNSFTSIGTTLEPILTIRPKTNFNSLTNRGLIIPDAFQLTTKSGPTRFEVVYNPSISGSQTFSEVNSDSLSEFSTGGDSISGGRTVNIGVAQSGGGGKSSGEVIGHLNKLNSREELTIEPDGTTNDDRLVVAAQQMSGETQPSVWASIDWQELR